MADNEDRTPIDELHYFGCFTGDCPHATQAECDAAIRAEFVALQREIEQLTAALDRANRALDEIIALDEKGPEWEPYDEFGDPSDIDESNSGGERRHGAWTAYQWAARIARAARTQPEGSNG